MNHLAAVGALVCSCFLSACFRSQYKSATTDSALRSPLANDPLFPSPSLEPELSPLETELATRVTLPKGFLMPVGGGASAGETGTLKPAQVTIHAAAVRQLRNQLNAGAQVGGHACVIEYHPDSQSTQDNLTVVKSLFIAGGLKKTEVEAFVFDTRAKASHVQIIQGFQARCGVVFIPGGDQTEMRALWAGTALHKAMQSILARGGGIMGKSAGAALQGSVGYFPEADSETTTGALLRKVSLKNGELTTGFFSTQIASYNKEGKGLPRFYVETHTGDRERVARSLSLLAAWEMQQPNSKKAKAFGIAVDSDTAALITFDAQKGYWIAEVFGARIAEFLLPTENSQATVTEQGQASYTNVTSSALLEGSIIGLSGGAKGSVWHKEQPSPLTTTGAPGNRNSNAPATSVALAQPAPSGECAQSLPRSIYGAFDSDAKRASSVTFEARDTTTGEVRDFNDVEYAYLMGNLLPKSAQGCGYWQAHAFNPDFGRPENRLNAQRYALGAGLAHFSISLADAMLASVNRSGDVTFKIDQADGSSSLVYDVRGATNKKVGRYVYSELGASLPVQVGAWDLGRVHLLAPGAVFSIANGKVLP